MLNSTFIDSLESDIELLERLNQFSHFQPADSAARGLAPVEVLVIAPSQPIDEIAARHRQELPAALRLFLRGPGATKTSGAGVLSYLLFEAGYCSELIELGRRDALAKREEIDPVFGGCPTGQPDICGSRHPSKPAPTHGHRGSWLLQLEVVLDQEARRVLVGLERTGIFDPVLVLPVVVFKTDVQLLLAPVQRLAQVIFDLRVEVQVGVVSATGVLVVVDHPIHDSRRSGRWSCPREGCTTTPG